MIHFGEGGNELAKYMGYAQDLRIQPVLVDDFQRKFGLVAAFFWITEVETDNLRTKGYFRASEMVNLEVFRATNELRELGNVKLGLLHEVFYPDDVELRCVDLGQEVLQVRAATSVVKISESGEDGSHCEILTCPSIRRGCVSAE